MGRRAQSQHYFRIDFKHFFNCVLNGLFVGRVVTPWGIWDVSSPTMDRTHTPTWEAWSLNHCTARKATTLNIIKNFTKTKYMGKKDSQNAKKEKKAKEIGRKCTLT